PGGPAPVPVRAWRGGLPPVSEPSPAPGDRCCRAREGTPATRQEGVTTWLDCFEGAARGPVAARLGVKRVYPDPGWPSRGVRRMPASIRRIIARLSRSSQVRNEGQPEAGRLATLAREVSHAQAAPVRIGLRRRWWGAGLSGRAEAQRHRAPGDVL